MRIFRVAIFMAFFLVPQLLFGGCAPLWAELSAQGSFVLIRKIPPGEEMTSVNKFLWEYSSEKNVGAKDGIKIRRWGSEEDDWFVDVLHNDSLVRASRITWRTSSRGEQQRVFAQLTTAGKKFFGRTGKFRGTSEAEWSSFEEKWLVRVHIGSTVEDGVTMLSGIRDKRMDSAKYGF